MFGLGKKKDNQAAGALAANFSLSDEQLVVMPEEYLPKGQAGQPTDKKLYWLAGGAVVFLLLLSGGLYFFLFLNPSEEAADLAVSEPVLNEAPASSQTATAPALKVITSQALDNAGQLLGTLNLSLPIAVTNQYGEALGVAVLKPADINLPDGLTVAGGIYSPYPVGAVFDEAVGAELTVAALPTPESRANYYPAALAGVVWQEIAATTTPFGWSFSLSKFPAGPMAVVERVATSTAATTTSPILGVSSPRPSADTDSDGLTDAEETLLGTNPALADTDNDTYADRSEIFNGYSPLAAGTKLESADLFATYTNPTYGYKAPYPKKWLADSLDQTNKQVLFISATEEFFEILIEDNPLKTPIVDWYRSQSPSLANAELDVTVLDGAGAVWSPDKLTLYVGRDGLVFILTYNKGTLENINWLSLFEYFYKNFKLGNTVGQSAPPA